MNRHHLFSSIQRFARFGTPASVPRISNPETGGVPPFEGQKGNPREYISIFLFFFSPGWKQKT